VKKPTQLQNKSPRKTTVGFFWGIVIASFGIFSYVMSLSTYEFQRTSKISLAMVLLASGAFGALVGEKFMEKAGE
jgi:CDP-diglyceride synthetase